MAKSSVPQSVNSIEYTNPVDVLTSKIFNIFDVFRGQLDNQDNIQTVLLLISLYKDDIINQEMLSDNFTISKLNKSILESDLKDSYKKTYLSISQMLSDNLTNVICHRHSYLSLYLFNIEHDLLVTYFPAAFDDTIYRIAQSQGRYAAEYIQPIELSRFLSKIVTHNENAKVYNPFAGMVSFGVNLDKNQSYFGQEINRKTWALGILRLMAYDRLDDSKYECADSLQEWPIDSRFDLIVSNPPFGMRIDIQDAISNSNIKTAEHFLIEKGIQSLKHNGKLIAVFSQGVLFRGGREQELRKKLVDENLIDTIISFPGGLFQHTAIPFIVMVLSKDKKLQNKVRFIKADNYVVEKNRREKVLHDELLLNVYNSNNDFSVDVRVIDNEVLRENDYNLSVNRYFEDGKSITELPAGAKVVELGKLVETLGRGFTDHDKAQIINISDLAESIDDFEKQVSDFQNSNIPISSIKIESSVLLLSKIRSLKPTFCKVDEGEYVYCNNNIVPLIVDESKIFIPYLILELNSERVSKFVKSRLNGISIPVLNKKDILEIPILLYSVEEQKAKFAGYIEAIAQKKKEELVSFSKIHGLEKEIYEQNTYLRHALSGTIRNVSGTFENINSIIIEFAKDHPEILLQKVSDKHKLTLKEYLENQKRDVLKISNLVGQQLKKDITFSEYPFEKINIIEFLENFTKEIRDDSTTDYEITLKIMEDSYELQDGKQLQPYIKANKSLLNDLLNNFIQNAQKHAFEPYFNNKIEIFLTGGNLNDYNMTNITLMISNTGKTLPEGFTLEDFARKGNAIGANAGDGFGGWYINEIVKHFGGKINVNNEQDGDGIGGEWATTFEIDLLAFYEENI